MSNPMAKYQGQHIITYTVYPHAYIRVIRPFLSPNAQSIYMLFLDEIFGWQRPPEHAISMPYSEIKRHTGIKDDGTITKCLDELKKAYLLRIESGKEKRATNTYCVNMDMIRWINDALVENKHDYEKTKEVYQRTINKIREKENKESKYYELSSAQTEKPVVEDADYMEKSGSATWKNRVVGGNDYMEKSGSDTVQTQTNIEVTSREINDLINKDKENDHTDVEPQYNEEGLQKLQKLLSGFSNKQFNKEPDPQPKPLMDLSFIQEPVTSTKEQEGEWMDTIKGDHNPPTSDEQQKALANWIAICGEGTQPTTRIFNILHKRGYKVLTERKF